jgi:N-acetyl-alpha-D-glucosaminyl L-malate synthase BshA
MKIGIVCYPTYGGSGVMATELGMGLAKKGHQIHFITYAQPTRLDFLSENLFYHEVSVKDYPLFDYPPYEIALAARMVDVVEYEKLDLLHVHYAIPHASAAILAKQILATKGITIPIVTTLHGTDITLVGKESTYASVVTYAINQSDVVTAVSNSLKRDTHALFDIQKEIKVIPNFVDIDKFKKQHKDHFKKAICPNGEKLMVHVSNFRKVKRVEDVITVFCKVSQQIPVKLLLVGDGPERSTMEKMTRETCSIQDVRFLGKMSNVEEILSVCDVFIMTSEKESFGLAALEAMACQVPLISTNVGGLTELNEDGVTGYTCDVEDIEEMVEKTLHVLHEDNLPKFKAEAYKKALSFELSQIMPMYEEAYEAACITQ